jgi:hypothetical protein
LSEFEIFVVYKENGDLFPEQIHVGHILIFDTHLPMDRNNLYILLDTDAVVLFINGGDMDIYPTLTIIDI